MLLDKHGSQTQKCNNIKSGQRLYLSIKSIHNRFFCMTVSLFFLVMAFLGQDFISIYPIRINYYFIKIGN